MDLGRSRPRSARASRPLLRRGPYGRRRRAGTISVDLRFEAFVELAERFGQPRTAVPRVYPRTRVARDAVGLVAHVEHGTTEPRRAVLVVQDREGAVVVRRDLVEDPTDYLPDGTWDAEMWEARDRPLPPGLYEARVRGTDLAGNRGTSRPLPLRVSERRLEWVEETRHVVPDDVDHSTVCGYWWNSNGCSDGDTCGLVLPSARFPGGLTHRAAPCDDYRSGYGPPAARTESWFPVPEAVRGLDALRVSFTGAPTVDGESDRGRLSVRQMTTLRTVEVASSTGGSTGWVEQPLGGTGAGFDHA